MDQDNSEQIAQSTEQNVQPENTGCPDQLVSISKQTGNIWGI